MTLSHAWHYCLETKKWSQYYDVYKDSIVGSPIVIPTYDTEEDIVVEIIDNTWHYCLESMKWELNHDCFNSHFRKCVFIPINNNEKEVVVEIIESWRYSWQDGNWVRVKNPDN